MTDTTREVSHEEATQIALRLIAGSFRRDGERLDSSKRPQFSIPTRPNHDDDCLIIAYIEQQQAAREQQWMPVKTAPKDGTSILLWAPDYFEDEPHAIVGEWCDRVGAWSSEVGMMEDGPIDSGDPEVCNGPSHWMPLPPAPQSISPPHSGNTDPSTRTEE